MLKNLSSILRSSSNTPTVANSDIPALANPLTSYLNWTGAASTNIQWVATVSTSKVINA